jgi:hypothetical protein
LGFGIRGSRILGFRVEDQGFRDNFWAQGLRLADNNLEEEEEERVESKDLKR